MVTYNQLEKEFDSKVKKLQASCNHKRLTNWLEEWWAPGHSTGNLIRRCVICNKIVGRRSY